MENLITPREAAKQLGVSTREIYRYIKTGRLDAYRIAHKTIRIRPGALEDFLKK